MVDLHLVHYPNLRMLKIFGFSDGSCVDIVRNLLMSSPSIETLLVGINQVLRIQFLSSQFKNNYLLMKPLYL